MKNNKNIIMLTVALVTLYSVQLLASGTPVAHQFKGGQPASASQVNSNFQELADRVAAISNGEVLDYRQYMSTANSKTYSMKGDSCADTETVTFVRTANGDSTNIKRTRERTKMGGILCRLQTEYLVATPTELKLESTEWFDEVTRDLVLTVQYLPARIRQTSAMGTGKQLAFLNKDQYIYADASPSTIGENYLDVFSAVGIEDVTVPAGTFKSCMKLYRTLSAPPTIGHYMYWYCPGVGKVKMVLHSFVVTSGSKNKTWELTAIN